MTATAAVNVLRSWRDIRCPGDSGRLASEEPGTKSKVATVNAALRRNAV